MVWEVKRQLQDRKYKILEILESEIKSPWIEYKAFHDYLEREVLIKTVDDKFKNYPDGHNYFTRLQTETEILTKLSDSPYIVKLIDFFEEDNIYCLVTDFIEGENLLEKVAREGALPEKDAIEYIRQVGSALVLIHNQGIVHRYINPANILLRDNNQVVLTNFSLATQIIPCFNDLSNNAVFTVYSQIEAPFQVTDDIYSLAATLYYLVTGKKPVSVAERKFNNQELIPPQQLNSQISDRTNDAILKGMALETSELSQTVENWLEILIESYFAENLTGYVEKEDDLLESIPLQSESIEIPNSLQDTGRWGTIKSIISITLKFSIFTGITGALLAWMDAPGWVWWWTLFFSIGRIAFATNNLTLAMFFLGIVIAIWGAGIPTRDGIWAIACFSGSLLVFNRSWISLFTIGLDILFGILLSNQTFNHIFNLTLLGTIIGLLIAHSSINFLLLMISQFINEEFLEKEGKLLNFRLFAISIIPGLAIYWLIK